MNKELKLFWIFVASVSSAYLLYKPKQLSLPAPAKEVVKPVAPKIRKAKSYNDALKLAQEYKKPIIFYFSSNHCYWCEKFKNETLNDEKVKEILDEYIFFEVKFDKNKSVCLRYEISVFPSYKIVEYIDNSEIIIKSGSGYKSIGKFLQWIILEKKN